jgi:hypothetical protein
MHRLSRHALWFFLGAGFLAVWSAIVAYYRVFTGFAEWDDEGTLMMTVRQFLHGSTLYEVVRSGYGPVYYYFNWIVRTLTLTDVNHDVTRTTSMVLWTACAMACAWIVWRFGKSLPAALITHFLVFRALSFFVFEPGHPQELCMLLLIALVGSGLLGESGKSRVLAIVLAGALPAALLLVKINIGIFAAAAVAVAMLKHSERGPLINAARSLAGVGAMLLPFVLMGTHLTTASEIAYCVVVAAGMAAIVATSVAYEAIFSARDCWSAAAVFAATCVLVLGILVLQGAAPSTILTSLVLDQIKLRVKQGNWYLPVGLHSAWILWAIAGLAAALLAPRARKQAARFDILSPVARIAISSVALLLAILESNQVIGLATPFCWIAAYPFGGGRSRLAYGRTLLAATAVLQTLYAYPVAGSQVAFTRVLLIVAAGVCLADALEDLPIRWRSGLSSKVLAAAIVTIILLSYPAQFWRARRTYYAKTPLGLPGAERIHVEPQEAAAFQWMVGQLKEHCDTFVGYPGIPSLYFWTGKPMPGPAKEPPGPLNADAWALLLSPAQQQAIVNEFALHPEGCVIYHPSGVSFWNPTGADERSLPLVQFVRRNFKTVSAMGDYEFQIRRERPWNANTLR